jgi:hypothetical protein
VCRPRVQGDGGSSDLAGPGERGGYPGAHRIDSRAARHRLPRSGLVRRTRAGRRLRERARAPTSNWVPRPSCVWRAERRPFVPPRPEGRRKLGASIARLEGRRAGSARGSGGSRGSRVSVAIHRSASCRRSSRGSRSARLHQRLGSLGARGGGRTAGNLAVPRSVRRVHAGRGAPLQRHVHTDGRCSSTPEGSLLASLERAERGT